MTKAGLSGANHASAEELYAFMKRVSSSPLYTPSCMPAC